MTSEADVKSAIQAAREKYGGLNATINCAGIGIAVLTYNKNKDNVHKLDDFQKVLNVRMIDFFIILKWQLFFPSLFCIETMFD